MTAPRSRVQPAADPDKTFARPVRAARSRVRLRKTAALTPADEGHGHASRGALVYRKLRHAIEQGELKPGQRVMEVEVAEWLDVSRTPVREALRRLENEGMLALSRARGSWSRRLRERPCWSST